MAFPSCFKENWGPWLATFSIFSKYTRGNSCLHHVDPSTQNLYKQTWHTQISGELKCHRSFPSGILRPLPGKRDSMAS